MNKVKEVNPKLVYEYAGEEIELIHNDCKIGFVEMHLLQGCIKVIEKGECNCAENGKCPRTCPLSIAATQAVENIGAGIKKSTDWHRTKSANGVEVMNNHDLPPKYRTASVIMGTYNPDKIRQIRAETCHRCHQMKGEPDFVCKNEKCPVALATKAQIAKLNRFKKEN